MWEPRRLTNLWASTICYRDSLTFFTLKTTYIWHYDRLNSHFLRIICKISEHFINFCPLMTASDVSYKTDQIFIPVPHKVFFTSTSSSAVGTCTTAAVAIWSHVPRSCVACWHTYMYRSGSPAYSCLYQATHFASCVPTLRNSLLSNALPAIPGYRPWFYTPASGLEWWEIWK
jgi:hypothetical protein